jgi:16S rRNA (guanine527-N7)-methyltransferase
MDIILKYFTELSDQQVFQFSKLDNLYREWNEKINVISRQDIDNLYLKHVLHSLSISKLIQFVPGTKILDIGTGGGFPGIPLAILFPSCQFYLNDSIGKKIMVVDHISKSAGLKNVTTINARAEMIKERFDFIVSRAVTSLPVFYSWVADKILSKDKNEIENGIIYLKGGEISGEIMDFKERIRIFPLSQYFSEEFFETKLILYLPIG